MTKGISKILLVLTVSFGLLACVSTSHLLERKLLDEGATALTKAEATALLSGKTEQWINGGAYFLANGSVWVKYEGRVYPLREWNVEKDGKVCIKFLDGVTSSCSRYYQKNGEIWVATLEIFGDELTTEGGPVTLLNGNKLSEL